MVWMNQSNDSMRWLYGYGMTLRMCLSMLGDYMVWMNQSNDSMRWLYGYGMTLRMCLSMLGDYMVWMNQSNDSVRWLYGYGMTLRMCLSMLGDYMIWMNQSETYAYITWQGPLLGPCLYDMSRGMNWPIRMPYFLFYAHIWYSGS